MACNPEVLKQVPLFALLDEEETAVLAAPGPTSILEMEDKVDKQVAAPAETRTPNLYRAKNRSHKSADGRVATVATRLGETTG